MRSVIAAVAVLACSEAFAQSPMRFQDIRFSGSFAGRQLESAMSSLGGADEALAAMQRLLERDAAVLAKLREARAILEEDTQPMTVVNAVAVRVGEATRLRPDREVRHALVPVDALLQEYRQSSANIDLPLLTREVDGAVNAASRVVVDDVRMMQPTLALITRMQEALQIRLSALVQSQGRAMELTASGPR